MFERYTEKARRVIFFARYEASQFGAPAIEPEHLLLGLMREDKTLTSRFLARAQASLEAIRKEIEGRAPLREKISTSVELPLAPETKRVLAYAHEESDRLQHRHIGTEHLLLGLLREDRSMAAEILYERGLKLHAVREEIARATGVDPRAAQKKETPHLAEFSRDLTDDAANDKLDPLVGRDAEIERVVQILCRRTKNTPSSSASRVSARRPSSRGWRSASCAARSLRSSRTSGYFRSTCRYRRGHEVSRAV
jgi:ATP-dependent Clp protease ATP-binding subunit ClpC